MKYKILLPFIFIIFLASCEETSKTVISVANDYNETCYGSMIANIENEGDSIQFKSKVEIEEGNISFCLVNPKKDTILIKTYSGFGSYEENLSYDRIIGQWVLYYSIKAEREVSPSGSFDFDIIFKD